jgi:hypothetical protein
MLTRARPAEGAIVGSQLLAARADEAAAVASLGRLLDGAPAGFAAWTLPVEPFLLLRQAQAAKGFAAVLRHLADRAG